MRLAVPPPADAAPGMPGDQAGLLRLAADSFFDHLSQMCEGLLVVDREARVVWVSDRYERYLPSLGLREPTEMLGRPVEEVVPNSLMRRVVESGQPILLDIIDNAERSFVVSRFPLRDAQGAVIGAIGMILSDRLESLQPLLTRLGRLQRDLDEARRQLAAQRRTRYSFASFIGTSPATLDVKSRARKAAALNSTVLLLGETGAGKELIAQAIHAASARAAGPFIAVNVAAVPESLMEAAFFGVAPGAFTGADRRHRDGKLALADGGTLLLDEVGDMPPAIQAKLLRVLQERQFEAVGSNRVVEVDVRVIAATSRDLKALVEQGQFRADLYYRLAVVPIRIPPLRERLADLPALAEHILERIAEENGQPVKELSADAIVLLQGLPWPGNVRELHNLLEQACAMTERTRLTRPDLLALLPAAPGAGDRPAAAVSSDPGPAVGAGAASPCGAPDGLLPAATTGRAPLAAAADRRPLPERVAELERAAIVEALHATGGNRRDAARRLGISRATLYERLKVFALG